MKKIRILVSLLTAIAMICTCFSGCTTKGINNDRRKLINIWHYWDDKESCFNKDIKAAIDEYQEQHPDLNISLNTLTENEYRSKLSTSFIEDGGQDIDVFAFWGGYQTDNLIDLGLLMPIEDYITNDVRQRVSSSGYSAFQNREGKIYALPTYSWLSTLYCNTELFNKYHLDLPETLDDLINVSKRLSNVGVTPLALGGKDGWQLDMLFESIALRMAGAEAVASFLNGNVKMADTMEFESAAQKFYEFKEKRIFGDTLTENDALEADDMFLRGDAAMRLTGSWLNDKIEDMEDKDFISKIKIIPFPVVNIDDKSYGSLSEHVGGYNHSFFVNNRTKYKDEAADICIYLSEVLGNTAEKNGYGFSAWTREPVGEDELSHSISQTVKESATLVPSWDIFVRPEYVDNYVSIVGQLFNQELSAKEFLNRLKQYVTVIK